MYEWGGAVSTLGTIIKDFSILFPISITSLKKYLYILLYYYNRYIYYILL